MTDPTPPSPEALRGYQMSNDEALKLWPPFKRMIGWIDSFRITHPNGLTLDEMHKAVAGYINTHYVHVDEHEKKVTAKEDECQRLREFNTVTYGTSHPEIYKDAGEVIAELKKRLSDAVGKLAQKEKEADSLILVIAEDAKKLRTAEAQVERLAGLLRKYGRHPEGAGCRYGNGCFCGLDAALKGTP